MPSPTFAAHLFMRPPSNHLCAELAKIGADPEHRAIVAASAATNYAAPRRAPPPADTAGPDGGAYLRCETWRSRIEANAMRKAGRSQMLLYMVSVCSRLCSISGLAAPIARSMVCLRPSRTGLGMGSVHSELGDLSFRYLEPEAFMALQKQVADKAETTGNFWKKVRGTIRDETGGESDIPAELEARVKGLYSLHPLVRQERPGWNRCITCWRCG